MDSEVYKIVQEFVIDTKELLKDNLIEEYLFGSYSKNEQNEWSDIDILIIVKKFNNRIRKDLSALSSEYSLDKGVLISPIVKDIDVWEKNKKYNTLFYQEIENYGIEL